MISSAVVIPEQEIQSRSESPSLKRRQSSATSDSNKRPRFDTDGNTVSGNREDEQSYKNATSPPRRKSGLGLGAAEERKRGQRLFGALLGTLSQTSSRPAHKKRDEIEQRQRERLRRDNEEREEEKKRKREELDRIRRLEQKTWDEESTRIRHRNMKATARFLQTKSEPRLFYKPWELRPEEEERIKRQIKETDQIIAEELGENIDKSQNTETDEGHDDEKLQPVVNQDADKNDIEMADSEPTQGNDKAGSKQQASDPSPSTEPTNKATEDRAAEERRKEDEHAGEELVEGQEDDVIY